MAKSNRPPGVISANEAYTLDEVKGRLGIEDRAWWKLRDSGLRFTKIGKGRVILGRDLLKTLADLSETDERPNRK